MRYSFAKRLIYSDDIRMVPKMSKVEEQIDNQESDIPPKKKKTKEDKEFEQAEVESTGGGFDAGGG
jgi:hypothetical protein